MATVFGVRLRALRKQKRISQSKLGKAVGVHYNQIGLYERGAALPSAPVLKALARVFETTVDALLKESLTPATPKEPVPDIPPPPPSPSEMLDTRLEELIEVSRTLSETDRRTVVALLDAFVLKTRIAALAGTTM